MSSPAAWHTDPTGKHDHRWWDGTKWTEHVADAGESKIDHLAPGEVPPAPAGEGPPPGGADTTAAGGAAAAGAGGTDATDATDAGSGGLSSAWEGTAQPDQGQPSWQQPGTTDPNATAQQPAWQQGATGAAAGYGAGHGAGGHGDQPAWDQGQSYGQPQNTGTDGVAIAALVIGILSLLTSWFLLGGLGGIIALILGVVALGRIKRNRSGGRGMAITGIVTGVLAVIVAVVVAIFFFSFFDDTVVDYQQCLDQGNDEAFCTDQLEEGIMDRFGN